MGGKHGVEQLWKILELVCEVGNVLEKLQGGGVRLFQFFQLSDEFMVLATLDAEELKNEFGELDEQDRAELLARLKSKLDLANDKLEAKLEEGAALAVDLVSLASRVVNFAKSL